MSDVMKKLNEAVIEAKSEKEAITAKIAEATAELDGIAKEEKDAVKAKKAQIKTLKTGLKTANKNLKEAESSVTQEVKKEALAAKKLAAQLPEQNGIRHPKPETVCGKVWNIADTLSKAFKQPTPIKELLEAARKEGMNEGNVKAEYARWRKFHGVTGRISLPKAEAPKAKAKAK